MERSTASTASTVLAGALALALLASCNVAPAPPAAPPPPPVVVAPAAPVPAAAVPVDVRELTVDPTVPASLRLRAPSRSREAVRKYELALKNLGWKERKPASPDDPGQRKWVTYDMPVPGGPSAAYESVWEEPGTGRVADLSVWEVQGEKGVQYGSFGVYADWETLKRSQR